MTNNNQECTCSKFSDLIIDTNGCKVHYLSPSQPPSVPVEKEIPHAHCRCMNIGGTCSNRHYADCDICKPNGNELKKLETSPSTPEVSWEKDLENEFGKWWDYKSLLTERIVDFIKSVEQKAYEKGKDEVRASTIATFDFSKKEERKRITDILDGMKKEGDDFQCFNTDCFGKRTPTVIEKRLSSEDNSYNQALIDLKHLINNTQ